MDMTPQAWPDWYDVRHINEVLFCQQFLEKHPMKCVRGRLFTVDGLIEDEGQIGKDTQQYTDFQLSAPSHRCWQVQYGQTCQSSQAGA